MPTVRVAVFDLGSSSFHLMVVDATRDGVLIPVLRRSSFLHLGTEVARTGGVPADGLPPPSAHVAASAWLPTMPVPT
jgi:exopolyphosphatase/pppGpp-phosphohydrolase